MKNKIHFGTLLLIVFSLFSCGNKHENDSQNRLSQEQITEKLVAANRATIETENKQIDTLIERSHWNMQKTQTGLRYEIIAKGNGHKAQTGKIAKIEFEVRLISGELIYSSKQMGPNEFKIGSGGVESGLEEGILMLNNGDSARLIIPSYLAHGLSGDQKQIPPKSTLLYTLKLIDLK